MKKLTTISILVVFVCVFSVAAQKLENEQLGLINQKLREAFGNNDLGQAEDIANELLEVCIREFGTDASETATAYTNLGVVYRHKGKFSKSVENFEKAIEIRSKNSGDKDLAPLYEAIAISYYSDSKRDEAKQSYINAIRAYEAVYGVDNKEELNAVVSLANAYAFDKKYQNADEYYLKAYSIVKKNFDGDEEKRDSIDDARTCGKLMASDRNKKEVDKGFSDKVSLIFGDDRVPKDDVVNGKALSLPKPRYPFRAREERLSGRVAVKVMIDERGNVSTAKAICGHEIFAVPSAEAAKLAKFRPTLVNGVPVEVSGIIIYSFSR